jgi:GGDEF domain-containing protein
MADPEEDYLNQAPDTERDPVLTLDNPFQHLVNQHIKNGHITVMDPEGYQVERLTSQGQVPGGYVDQTGGDVQDPEEEFADWRGETGLKFYDKAGHEIKDLAALRDAHKVAPVGPDEYKKFGITADEPALRAQPYDGLAPSEQSQTGDQFDDLADQMLTGAEPNPASSTPAASAAPSAGDPFEQMAGQLVDQHELAHWHVAQAVRRGETDPEVLRWIGKNIASGGNPDEVPPQVLKRLGHDVEVPAESADRQPDLYDAMAVHALQSNKPGDAEPLDSYDLSRMAEQQRVKAEQIDKLARAAAESAPIDTVDQAAARAQNNAYNARMQRKQMGLPEWSTPEEDTFKSDAWKDAASDLKKYVPVDDTKDQAAFQKALDFYSQARRNGIKNANYQQFLQKQGMAAGDFRDMPGGSNSIVRDVYGALANTGASFAGLVAKGGAIFESDPDVKKAYEKMSADIHAKAQGMAAGEAAVDPGLLNESLRAVAGGLTQAAATGPAAGLTTLSFMATGANSADETANELGLKGYSKYGYVGGTALLMGIMGKATELLGGGAEGLVQKTASNLLGREAGTLSQEGAKAAISNALKSGAYESLGFIGVSAAQKTLDKIAGADPNKDWTTDDLKQVVVGSVMQSMMTAAYGQGQKAMLNFAENPSQFTLKKAGVDVPVSADGRAAIAESIPTAADIQAEFAKKAKQPTDAQSWARANPDAAAELAKNDTPSRSDFQKAGITDRMSAVDRAAFADRVRQHLQAQSGDSMSGAEATAENRGRISSNDYPDNFKTVDVDALPARQATPDDQSRVSTLDEMSARRPPPNRDARRAELEQGQNQPTENDVQSGKVRDLEQRLGRPPYKQEVADALGITREDARDALKRTYGDEPQKPPFAMSRAELNQEAKGAGIQHATTKSEEFLRRKIEETQKDSLGRTAKDLQENTSAPERPYSKPIEEMTPQELQDEVRQLRTERHTDELTGLKNGKAYNEVPKKAVQTFMDADGLKSTNDRFGHAAGNALLQAVANAAREAGLSTDVYRMQGDEHAMQHDTIKQAKADQEKLQKVLEKKVFRIRDSDGTVYEAPLRMSFGFGSDIDKAEEATKEMKNAREQSGQRELRSDWEQRFKADPTALPRGFNRVPAERVSVSGGVRQGNRSESRPATSEAPQSQSSARPESAASAEHSPDSARTPVADEAPPREQQPAARQQQAPEDLSKLSFDDLKSRATELGVKWRGLSRDGIEKRVQDAIDKQNIVHMGSFAGAFHLNAGDLSPAQGARDAADFFQGKALPRLSREAPAAADALVRHAASTTASRYIADEMLAKVVGKDEALGNRAMAVMDEDNARGTRRAFLDRAAAATAKGDTAAAKEFTRKADAVKSSVGDKDWSNFKNEAEYEKEKSDPRVQAAIQKWKAVVNPWMDEQYRTTKGLAADADLPSRGLEFGARINRLANEAPGEESKTAGTGASGNHNAPRQNFNPFTKQATGAAQFGYSSNMRDVLENSINNVYAKATRLRAIEALSKSGMAQLGGDYPATLNGEKVRAITVEVPGPNGLEAKKLYVAESIEGEVKRAMDTDMRSPGNLITKTLNAVQMTGLADPAFHIRNQIAAIGSAPGAKNAFADIARKVPGVNLADTAFRMAKANSDIMRRDPATLSELSRLAQIDAMRAEHPEGGNPITKGTSSLIAQTDKVTRLVLSRLFDGMVARGEMKDTEANRREFVNQAGSYNRRTNSPLVNMGKETGIAPFITAGTTFNRLGVRALTGGYAGEASTTGAAIRIRAAQLAGLLTKVATVSALNYLINGRITTPGVPIGGLDLGKKDERGNPIYIDLLGMARRGESVTGTGKVIEDLRQGRTATNTVDDAIDQMVNANLHPLLGPSAKFAITALTGARPSVDLGPAGPAAAPGESKFARRFGQAARDIAPIGVQGAISLNPHPLDELKGLLTGAVGIKSGYRPMTSAVELASEYRRANMGEKNYSEEERNRQEARRQVERDVRAGMTRDEAMNKAVETGLVNEKQALASAKRGSTDEGSYVFKSLSAEQGKKVLQLATDEEKAAWQPMQDHKVALIAAALAQKRPLSADKLETWKANTATAGRRLKDLGVSLEDARVLYWRHLVDTVKNPATRQADYERFLLQMRLLQPPSKKPEPELVTTND